MELACEVQDLAKAYRGKSRALDGINLRVERGSLVGLLGPNGAGKSTLIKILVGLIRDFSGRARVGDTALPSRSCAAKIGYMPQRLAIYEDLSVGENIGFFASLYGLKPGRETARRIAHLIDFLALGDKRAQPASTLSGGMRQRLSLGCAMIHDPDILFLDEPTVGLDPALRLGFWGHFKELAAKGRSIIVCSHAFDEIKHMSHLAFLANGRLVSSGRVADLAAHSGMDQSAILDWEAFYMAQSAATEAAL